MGHENKIKKPMWAEKSSKCQVNVSLIVDVLVKKGLIKSETKSSQWNFKICPGFPQSR